MEDSIMTHPTNRASTPTPTDPLGARYDRDFQALGEYHPDVLTLTADLTEIVEERDAATTQAIVAEQERDEVLATMRQQCERIAANNTREGRLNSLIAGLRHEVGQMEGENTTLREALALIVAGVMDGAGDPLGAALDVLDVAGISVPVPTATTPALWAVAA
jgi:hypothetical protein